jgi:hypothetical protein
MQLASELLACRPALDASLRLEIIGSASIARRPKPLIACEVTEDCRHRRDPVLIYSICRVLALRRNISLLIGRFIAF